MDLILVVKLTVDKSVVSTFPIHFGSILLQEHKVHTAKLVINTCMLLWSHTYTKFAQVNEIFKIVNRVLREWNVFSKSNWSEKVPTALTRASVVFLVKSFSSVSDHKHDSPFHNLNAVHWRAQHSQFMCSLWILLSSKALKKATSEHSMKWELGGSLTFIVK